MGRVYLDFKDGKWNEVAKSDFWIDRLLLIRLQNLKMIQGEEWDGVIIIDGPERSGKSILGMICGWYLSDCKLTENNFARGLSDVAKKIADLPEKSVLIMDEASTIFASKEGASKSQRKLIKILDVVGQKNLLFILCLPCFFDLNKTLAVRRSKFLLHVYPDDKYKRGQYVCWGERVKPKLYKFGKKNFDSYAYPPPSDQPGQYFNFKPPFYDKYLRQVKAESLQEVLNDATEEDKGKLVAWKRMVEIAGRIKDGIPGISDAKIGKILEIPPTTINDWVGIYNKAKELKVVSNLKEIAGESDEITMKRGQILEYPIGKQPKGMDVEENNA